jgi:transposase
MRKEREHYTAEEKVAILRRHLLDQVPVSDLCEEPGLQPTVFYRWQKEFFENGAAAFQTTERPGRQAEEKQKRASEPVIASMAGFAFPSRFHLPGGHISTPAPRR